MNQSNISNEQQFAYIPLNCIRESTTNPRRSFDQDALEKLADSIRDHGVAQPILVRPITKEEEGVVGEVEIVFGARRFRASKIANAESIPAMVRELTDRQVRILQTIENIQREDVNPIEEADGYKSMMEDFEYTADMLAAEIKKSRAYIYGRLKLCSLSSDIRNAVYDGKLNAATAELIARMPSVLQSQATQEIIENDGEGEPMSYRAAREYVKDRYMLDLASATFPITDAKLVPKAGSCEKCPKRTGNQPELFQDVKSADVCTDPDCFASKNKAFNEKVIATAKKKGIQVHEGDEAEEIYESGDFVTLDDSIYYFDRQIEGIDDDQDVSQALPEKLRPEPVKYVVIDGKAEPLFEKTAIQEALEKAGLCETIDAYTARMNEQLRDRNPSTKADPQKQYKEEQEFKTKQAELHEKFRSTIYEKIRETIDMSDVSMRIIVERLYALLGYNAKAQIYKLFNIESQDEFEALVNASAGDELHVMVRDIAIASTLHIHSWTIDKKTGNPSDDREKYLIALAADNKIDVEAIRAEIIPKPEKAKKKAKTKTESEAGEETTTTTTKKAKSKKLLDPAAAWPFPTGSRLEPDGEVASAATTEATGEPA